MADVNGPLQVQPWTCPHCAAVWHSGRQYCVDCGYGVVNTAQQTQLLEGLAGMPRVSAEEVASGAGAEAVRRVQDSERMRARAEALETHEQALRRSLEAESALQAEVTVLRERVGQLTSRLDEQRQTFVAGVRQMMQPAVDYFAGRKLVVPFEALMPRLMQELGRVSDLSARVDQLQAEAQTLQSSGAGTRVAPEGREVQAFRVRV